MYDLERQAQILDILKEKKSISVEKLASLLYVSTATVRRDLNSMEKRGLINRTFGGAVLTESPNEESSIVFRKQSFVKEKRYIAEKCVDFLQDNKSYFLDSSSTVSFLVPFFKDYKRINVITNGIDTASILSSMTSCEILLCGGYLQSRSNSLLGNLTLNTINKFNCDYSIISCSGLSSDFYLTETSIDQAEIKIAMVENSQKIILLIDSSKFCSKKLFKSIKLNKVDYIITDKKPPEMFEKYCSEQNIKLIY